MTKIFNAQIISTGSYLPQKFLTNFDLEKTIDTTNEWIVERTGINKRHIAAEGELTSDIGYKAAKIALEKSGLQMKDIGMIIFATTTPDLTFPSTAAILQQKLTVGDTEKSHCFAFDVQAVCSGFVYALNIANNFIKLGQVKNALVIGADVLSRIVDWKDRNTCVLFGDGAGAVVLSATADNKRGIIANDLYSDGSLSGILNTSGGVSSSQNSGFIQMQGKEVFKHAVDKMVKSVIDVLAKANLEPKDIDWLIPHQANARILSSVAKKLGLSEEKVIMTVADHANTSAASIPLALDFALKNNKIKKGDIVVFEALGGGLTWGSVVVRW
ncbi:MAG: fabH [Rickettsiaceae bacterium]|jgi:3-oxoacyl-[acyl-carrier-protein] synthase-3|nr:fabH [Rickettsiaceae bacterium]